MKNQNRVVFLIGCGYFYMELYSLEPPSQKAVLKSVLNAQQKACCNNDFDCCFHKSSCIPRYYWTNVPSPSKHISFYRGYKPCFQAPLISAPFLKHLFDPLTFVVPT